MADAFTINSITTGHGSISGATSSAIAAGAEVGGKSPWTAIGYSADVSTAQNLRDSPSTGKQYLESIDISCEALATGETISILDDSDLQIGPIPTLGEWSYTFSSPLEFSGAIKILTSAARPVMVIAEGYDT